MTAWDWALLFGCCGLLAAIGVHCARRPDDDRDAWQESTTTARTEDDVRADVAAWRRRREPAIETEAGDPYSDDRIELERMFIPQQRTEDHR
ncbi:hypothetical protein ACIQWN_28720 [Streptomyces vinaceus]|uniref:hypothetical protein n=1 Tax=Streptomyces vinaceus TaxID=1960 RepID=UPI00382194DC